MSAADPRTIEVALPLPLFRTFTYAVPAPLAMPPAGARVVVPVRSRREIGISLGPTERRGSGDDAKRTTSLRDVVAVPDEPPVLSAAMLELARWMSGYYAVPIGIVLRSMLPAALSHSSAPEPRPKTHRIAHITRELPSLVERDELFARTRRQRQLYEALEQLGGRAEVSHLTSKLGFTDALVRALAARDVISVTNQTVARDPFAKRRGRAEPTHHPSPRQRAAIDALVAGRPGNVFLLHGITGSGKTLVYLEFLREVVDVRGQSAIVLVPEISLTPQTVNRFRSVFGDRVAVLHSALSDGERYDAWLALKRGTKRIAVGARSAIFAPLEGLGAIVVDEEHEGSYKNGETPRYHAREVAIVRARLDGAVVVLGSATPSLESWNNAEAGKYTRLTLPDRVGRAQLPSVEVVDMRVAARPPAASQQGTSLEPFRRVFSESLEAALGERLAKGEQSILLLNRRGYASFLQCEACGDVRTCPDCSVSLTYHRLPERLVCHYCLRSEAVRATCPRCGGHTVTQRGLGTQQAERLLTERYPQARIARMDVDTTSGKWAHADILDRVGAGEVDILLGTQMIAKGLDFPNVTLVGVLDADVGINLPDFRASERCFQLLSQVAGRAGRGPKGGEVIIQTRVPGHHAVQCAVSHDYLTFVRQELAGRRQPEYPPCTRLAHVVVSGLAEEPTATLAQQAADWIQAMIRERGIAHVTVVGPAPCPIERIKRRWRWHLLLKSPRAKDLSLVTRAITERLPVPAAHSLRITVDRDPVAVL